MNDFEWAKEIPSIEPLTEEGTRLGLRVKIREDSRFYDGGDGNPKEVWGTIIRHDLNYTSLSLEVEWDNEWTNRYKYEDLDVVK